MDMEYKDVPVELKGIDEKGEGVLRFIKFNQEDKDSDITLPGFINKQDAVLLSGHNWKSDFPPLGYGSSFEADGATNFRFKLNLADERAKAWHSWLKMGHNLQQVSYGFSPYADGQERGQKDGKPVRFLKPRPDGSPGAKLHEVSFVVVGSGNDTAILSVKAFDDLPEPEEHPGSLDDLKAAGVRIQSLIFPKSKWDDADAVRSWLSSHDYSTSLDATGSSWRARQESPERFTRLRSFCINPSRDASSEECRVMAVGGPMKETRGVDHEHPPVHTTAVDAPGWHVVGVHHTGLDDSPFEPTRHYKRVQASQAAGLYRCAFAVQWPGTSPDMKESWGLLHHVIDDDGKPGAASLHACLTGMSLLKGWDGLFLPESTREELHAHYAAHLHDGGVDVPELMKRDSGIEIKHELRFWLWLAKSVIDRRERVQEFLIRVGKDESKELVEQFDQLFRYVTHMHGVAGSAGEAMTHLAEQEELSQRAQQITQELAEEALREEEAKQAEIKELFERFRANHG